LGKPQGIDFLIKIVAENEHNYDSFIMIVGSGTEFGKIQNWFNEHNPQNAKLMSALPKAEYDKLIKTADVGLIFLDPRFTIPKLSFAFTSISGKPYSNTYGNRRKYRHWLNRRVKWLWSLV